MLLDSLKTLEEWFKTRQRTLPWRDDPSIYRVWISEIMLQQTQVTTVIPYFERFISNFPDIETLAKASLDDILLNWAGLGYYSRARNLHKASKIISERGGFPDTREDMEKLPGIGRYTAGAVLSISMGLPEAILDANVKRVLSRIRGIQFPGKEKKRLWKWSDFIVKYAYQNGIGPSQFNQALMELGALICKSSIPQCFSCALKNVCKAYKKGIIPLIDLKIKKEWIKVKEKRFGVLNANNQLLLKRADPSEWRAGLWDLPNVKPDWIILKKPIRTVTTIHTVTNHKITRITELYQKSEEKTIYNDNYYWFPLDQLESPSIALGSAVKKVISKII